MPAAFCPMVWPLLRSCAYSNPYNARAGAATVWTKLFFIFFFTTCSTAADTAVEITVSIKMPFTLFFIRLSILFILPQFVNDFRTGAFKIPDTLNNGIYNSLPYYTGYI